ATSGAGRVCGEVHRALRTPNAHRRRGPQPAPRSARRLRRRDPRHREPRSAMTATTAASTEDMHAIRPSRTMQHVAATPAFRGRARECKALDQLPADARQGQSGVLVIRGEAGIGKTSLLRYCRKRAAGCRLAEIAGVESEMELPFAALHQLCTPMLD